MKHLRLLLTGLAALAALMVGPAPVAQAATFTVDSTLDTADASPGDGACDDGSGNCTLRAAIQEANHANNPGTDTINFSITGAGPHTFSPGSALPAISDPVIIDGTSEPDFVSTPVIELDGASAGAGVHGLTISAGSSTVKGLVINGFSQSGIKLSALGSNLIQGNFIGTDINGTADSGNAVYGVWISSSPANTVGGTTAGERNVISGNDSAGVRISGSFATGNTVEGNYIGTDITGTADLGNSLDGVSIGNAPGNTIGGTAGNVISGNNSDGVDINGSGATGNAVEGNLIGTNATGTLDLGNSSAGVQINAASSNTIGGTTSGAGNVISGNLVGVRIRGGAAAGNKVEGNFIGTDVAGTSGLGNSGDGVSIENVLSNTIGGTAPGARNVISGNGGDGVEINGVSASGNKVEGNYIGTDVNGATALGNGSNGVLISGAPTNTIGGTATGARNVISGNDSDGVEITGTTATGNALEGNYIGTQADGISAMGNSSHGVFITSTANNNTIGGAAAGAGNTIANNGGDGVFVDSGTGNLIDPNSIHSNGGLGIDLGANGVTANDPDDPDTGPNNLQNFPDLTLALSGGSTTTIQGTLDSTASTTFDLEFFSNTSCDTSGNGEGETFLASTTTVTDVNGDANFTVLAGTAVPLGQFITATATDPSDNTSEFSQCQAVQARSFTVNSTGDAVDASAGNGVCETVSPGECTLRAVIEEANALGGTDTIEFDIAGAGPHTISPGSALPTITDPAIIDGTSEPDFAGTPIIELDGSGAGAAGLRITAGSSVVKGLVINSFSGDGIELSTNGGNTIEGNYIGTDTTGTVDEGNGANGVYVNGVPNNTIGGTATGAGNVISGNGYGVVIGLEAAGNKVQGNYIGTDVNGTAALGNDIDGVRIISASSNTIGGTAAGAGNVISGNGRGIWIVSTVSSASGNLVQGNYIGTDVTGTTDLGNAAFGVSIGNASNNTIGGATSSAGNVISGNDTEGVFIEGSAMGNEVLGNYIGTDVTGASPLGNTSDGVYILSGASDNTIGGTPSGESNTIAYNGGDGIRVSGASTTGNTIRGNSIHSNTGLGIENIDGGNTELAPPVITAISSASGTACANCSIDVYSDDAVEGRVYEGSTAADGAGNWSLSGSLTGPNVTVTATDAGGNTSEFATPLPDNDGDGVVNTSDNCPFVANGAAEAATPGVGNQTNTDADLGTAIPPATFDGVPIGDSLGDACDSDDDDDGYTDVVEAGIGTTPVDNCTNSNSAGPGPNTDAFPSDMNKDDVVAINDVTGPFAPHFSAVEFVDPTGTNPGDYNPRVDLNQDGVIAINDITGPFAPDFAKICT